MNIQFYAKNVDLTEEIKDYINDKIGGLEKYDSGIMECGTDLSKDSHHQKGEIYRFEVNMTLNHSKSLLRVECFGKNAMEAIDLAKDKLKRQITDLKA